MSQSIALIQQLQKILKQSGFTYQQLADAMGYSQSNVKRIFSEKRMTLDQFEKICTCIGTDMFDVALQAKGEESDSVAVMTRDQEATLAGDRGLFIYFYLLARKWSPSRIAKRFDVKGHTHEKILLELDREKLIEYQTEGRAKLLVDGKLSWRPGGPLYNKLVTNISSEFFESEFSGGDSFLRFLTGEASAHSMALLQKRISEFSKEIQDIIERDSILPKNETIGFGMILGLRPWIFSLLKNWDGKSRESIV